MLLLMVPLAALGGIFAKEELRLVRQRAAVTKLQAAGAIVNYDGDTYESQVNPVSSSPWWVQRIFGSDAYVRVRTVSLRDRSTNGVGQTLSGGPTDDDLEPLFSLSGLENVSLYSPQLTPAGWESLARCPSLKAVLLNGANVTDDALRAVSDLPSLEEIRLGDTSITAAGLRSLRSGQVRYLGLDGASDELLREAAAIPKLDSLQVTSAPITADGLRAVADSCELSYLSLLRTPNIDDRAMEVVGAIASLESLRVHEASISAVGVQQLTRLPKLRELHLSGVALGDDAAAQVARLRQLSILRFANTTASDDGAAELAKLSNLEVLLFHSAVVGDEGIARLRSLSKLKQLDLYAPSATDEGVAQLSELRNLEVLWVTANMTAEAAAELQAALPNCGIMCHHPTKGEIYSTPASPTGEQ